MNEIERLELINKSLVVSRRTSSELIEINNEKIAELKKEAEVKPVFPVDRGYDNKHDYLHIHGYASAGMLGLSAYSGIKLKELIAWLEARAYIIEEINKANKGDNIFKYGKENWYIRYNYESEKLESFNLTFTQELESGFYMRERPSDDFIAELIPHYKIVFGIE
jgi:hypothetical protein